MTCAPPWPGPWTGRMPKGLEYAGRQVAKLRRFIEAETRRAHGGEISATHACIIASLSTHEARRLTAVKWLADEAPTLKVSERLAVLEVIGRASDARDRCLKSLDLDRDPNQFDPKAFYASLAQPVVHDVYSKPSSDSSGEREQGADRDQDAAGAQVGDEGSGQ